MGQTVLNSSLSGDSKLVDSFAAHVWCTGTRQGAPAGAVTVAYTNYNDSAVTITVPQLGGRTLPRTQYVLTSTPDGSNPNLGSGVMYNNGAALTVGADGVLPAYPIPGSEVTSGGSGVTVPAYSYGFVVFENAGAAACQ
jgi:hypothetical protein